MQRSSRPTVDRSNRPSSTPPNTGTKPLSPKEEVERKFGEFASSLHSRDYLPPRNTAVASLLPRSALSADSGLDQVLERCGTEAKSPAEILIAELRAELAKLKEQQEKDKAEMQGRMNIAFGGLADVSLRTPTPPPKTETEQEMENFTKLHRDGRHFFRNLFSLIGFGAIGGALDNLIDLFPRAVINSHKIIKLFPKMSIGKKLYSVFSIVTMLGGLTATIAGLGLSLYVGVCAAIGAAAALPVVLPITLLAAGFCISGSGTYTSSRFLKRFSPEEVQQHAKGELSAISKGIRMVGYIATAPVAAPVYGHEKFLDWMFQGQKQSNKVSAAVAPAPLLEDAAPKAEEVAEETRHAPSEHSPSARL